MFEEMGKTEAAITAKVNTTWNRLFGSDENYKVYYEVAGDMAYIYDSGNDDVRSEGMSYGMMMAVQMNKQTEFNKLWRWAKTNMYNETNQKNCRGYFAWQCGTNGNKKDAGCAPDGEFYFATALLFAHARWGSGSGVLDYRKHAMQLLYDMLNRTSPPDNYGEPAMFRDTDYNGAGKYMTVFQPQGSAGQFTDPSYHLPAFYEVWAIELEKDANAGNLHGIWSNAAAMKTDAAFYRSAVTASRGLFKNAVNATTGLGPDYSHFTGAAYGSDAHSHFEYDAFRTVMNAAMDYSWFAVDSWQKTYADTLQSFFHSKGVNSYTALWTLTGTSRGGDHSPGLIACNSVASLAATHQRAWDFLDDFWEISMTPGKYRYYDGCLYMLGLLHVTGNFKAYLSGNTVIIPSSSISPTTATFDKKTDLQADITVTMTLNGNDFVSIQNGGTTLSGVTDYTRSGDTVTLKKEYFAAQPVGTTTLTFYFSGGVSRTIVITIKETSEGGGGTAGTKYDFSTDTVTATFTPGSNAGSTATVMPATNGGVLNVNVKGANDLVLIPFDLGTTTLADYASIKIEIASISGDTNFKDLYIFVPNLSTGTYPSGDFNGVTNMRIAYQGNALTGANSWNSYTLTLNSTYATTAYTGEVKLAFGFRGINNSGLVYQIRSVELVLK
jgi:endo-1,4-beta-D-glucanase Y